MDITTLISYIDAVILLVGGSFWLLDKFVEKSRKEKEYRESSSERKVDEE